MKTVDIYIITFYSDLIGLSKVLKHLKQSSFCCPNFLFQIFLIDNSFGRKQNYFQDLEKIVSESDLAVNLYKSPYNMGFGKANNLAFDISSRNSECSEYILVLNPDAFLKSDSLYRALQVMSEKEDVGVVLPRFLSETGDDLYLCKKYPSIFILYLRGFAPLWMKKIFKSSLDTYDLKSFPTDEPHLQAVVGSGACFLMRRNIWEKLQGFDPNFFLYFEDFDLIFRANKITRVFYEPSFEVIHLGGNTSKKGLTHIKYFFKSAMKFFKKNGWKFF